MMMQGTALHNRNVAAGAGLMAFTGSEIPVGPQNSDRV